MSWRVQEPGMISRSGAATPAVGKNMKWSKEAEDASWGNRQPGSSFLFCSPLAVLQVATCSLWTLCHQQNGKIIYFRKHLCNLLCADKHAKFVCSQSLSQSWSFYRMGPEWMWTHRQLMGSHAMHMRLIFRPSELQGSSVLCFSSLDCSPKRWGQSITSPAHLNSLAFSPLGSLPHSIYFWVEN
jgi:hypothetical protein